MSRSSGIFAIVLAVAAIGSLLFSQIGLAILFGAVALSMLAIASMKRNAVAIAQDPTEDLDGDSRALFSPIKRSVNEIEELVNGRSDSTTMRVVGTEALNEAYRIRSQIGEALKVRTALRKAGREKSLAAKSIVDLEEQLGQVETEDERASIASALSARKLELSHYDSLDKLLTKIDGGVRQAEAALAEMKARLKVGASSEKADLAVDENIRDTISRMRSLSLSYDEAQQFLRES